MEKILLVIMVITAGPEHGTATDAFVLRMNSEAECLTTEAVLNRTPGGETTDLWAKCVPSVVPTNPER